MCRTTRSPRKRLCCGGSAWRRFAAASGVWIHENAERDADVLNGTASRLDSVLQTARVTASYLYERTIGASFQYFSIWGDSDPVLFAPAAVTGSGNGSPNSNGEVLEVDYLPWLNTKLSVQYIMYNRFNGGKGNYDGTGNGRSASDNDTLFVNFWFAF